MGKLSWNTYYKKYWDMTSEEQIKYSNALTNYGDPNEVFEVLMGFEIDDEEHAKKFLKRVYTAGIRFTSEQVCDCIDIAEFDLCNYLVLNATTPFTKDEIVSIISFIPDETLYKILDNSIENIYEDGDFIYEMIQEVIGDDENRGKRLIEKVLSKRVSFKPEQIIEFIGFVDTKTLSLMASHTDFIFTKEQLDDIFMEIDDSTFKALCKRANINYLEDETNDENINYPFDEREEYVEEKKTGPGFFSSLLLGFGLGLFNSVCKTKKKHNGICDGDCANCPPHYGYRYGRWYYGHSHIHGCEFGGNKGDGGRD